MPETAIASTDYSTTTYRRPAVGSRPLISPFQHLSRPSYQTNNYDDLSHVFETETPERLGIDLCNPDLQLPDLLNNIAAYEQAVGRAFLSRRSQSYPTVPRQPMLSALFDDYSFMQPDEIPQVVSHTFSQTSPNHSNCTTPHSEQSHFNFSSPHVPFSTWQDSSIDQQYRSCVSRTEKSCDNTSESWRVPEKLHSQEFDFLTNFETISTNSNEQNLHHMERTKSNFADSDIATELDAAAYRSSAQSSVSATETDRLMSPLTDYSQPQHPMLDSFSDTTTFQGVRDIHMASEESPRKSMPHRSISAGNSFRGWSVESDNALRAEVNAQKAAGIEPLQWSKIALRIGRRSTGVQCQARWAEVLDERIKKGRWAADEDESLRQGYKKHGTQWSKIAEGIGSRTQRQCRSRWLQLNGPVASAPTSHDSRGHREI